MPFPTVDEVSLEQIKIAQAVCVAGASIAIAKHSSNDSTGRHDLMLTEYVEWCKPDGPQKSWHLIANPLKMRKDRMLHTYNTMTALKTGSALTNDWTDNYKRIVCNIHLPIAKRLVSKHKDGNPSGVQWNQEGTGFFAMVHKLARIAMVMCSGSKGLDKLGKDFWHKVYKEADEKVAQSEKKVGEDGGNRGHVTDEAGAVDVPIAGADSMSKPSEIILEDNDDREEDKEERDKKPKSGFSNHHIEGSYQIFIRFSAFNMNHDPPFDLTVPDCFIIPRDTTVVDPLGA